MIKEKIISKENLFDELKDGKWHTYAALINDFDVLRKTIKRCVTYMLKDGWCIINGPKGIKLINKDDMNEETAQEVLAMLPWIFGLVNAMSIRSIPIKKIMPAIRKCLPKTKEERQYLRSIMMRITNLIDV